MKYEMDAAELPESLQYQIKVITDLFKKDCSLTDRTIKKSMFHKKTIYSDPHFILPYFSEGGELHA